MEKIKLKYPVVVEGRYDKSTLLSIFDATVITTGGFAIFNSAEKKSLIKRLGQNGIILLTDSDGGGRQIRSYLHGILGKEAVYDAYIPKIAGKEKRKKSPSRAGLLGVEGVGREALTSALSPFAVGKCDAPDDKRRITKTDLYLDGLTGGENSSERRARLLTRLSLPDDMTASAMLEALNLITDYDTYKELAAKLSDD